MAVPRRKQKVINTKVGEILTMNVTTSRTTLVRTMLVMLGVLALLVAFAAPSRSASAHSNAYVRVVHAAPGAPVVDVYVDGSKLLNDFTFGSVTGYVAVA